MVNRRKELMCGYLQTCAKTISNWVWSRQKCARANPVWVPGGIWRCPGDLQMLPTTQKMGYGNPLLSPREHLEVARAAPNAPWDSNGIGTRAFSAGSARPAALIFSLMIMAAAITPPPQWWRWHRRNAKRPWISFDDEHDDTDTLPGCGLSASYTGDRSITPFSTHSPLAQSHHHTPFVFLQGPCGSSMSP